MFSEAEYEMSLSTKMWETKVNSSFQIWTLTEKILNPCAVFMSVGPMFNVYRMRFIIILAPNYLAFAHFLLRTYKITHFQ